MADPLASQEETAPPTPFEIGYLIGILVGEGSFGGDGKQPQVTLRMHTDHEPLFLWIMDRFPGGKLYGPYHHGGRSYYQWMARGVYLRDRLLPLLDAHFSVAMDGRSYERFQQMKADYARQLADPLRAIDEKLRRLDEE